MGVIPHTEIPIKFSAINFLLARQLQTLWYALEWPEFPGLSDSCCLWRIRAVSGHKFQCTDLFSFFCVWTFMTIAPRSPKSPLKYCMKIGLCFSFMKGHDLRRNIFEIFRYWQLLIEWGLWGREPDTFVLPLFCPLQIQEQSALRE